jgi:excisionase family DNA binding protein
MPFDPLITVSEAAKISKKSKQSVYLAIRLFKLKVCRVDGQIMVPLSCLEEYRSTLYSRMHRARRNGEKVFGPGKYTVAAAAEKLKVPTQSLYYAIRTRKIRYHRRGVHIVLREEDIEEYKKTYINPVRVDVRVEDGPK